jgi:hypothetical protein
VPPFAPTTSSKRPDAIDQRFAAFCAALEERHLAHLTFQEVRRALSALSTVYVERRDRLARGAALDGAGKRAAFALFYGPLHFLSVREVVRGLAAASPAPREIVDLGCGTGVGSAAWASECLASATATSQPPGLLGVDENRWALGEAQFTWGHFGLRGTTRAADASRTPLGGAGTAILAAYTVNELDEGARAHLLGRLTAAAQNGARILIIEPIARREHGYWPAWEHAFTALGGRSDEWQFRPELPDRLRLLDKAAGLHHDVVKARSVYLPGASR